ncbi:hypothetical protein EK21DRAFT_111549 [Setomelanomma holmii]|uniref:F-box domain-containing protein n=1 Tax=Setomelanomma holmii TaxID=210430 RepID=A0A9P4HA64_9PLEO|nr:hypothetical protein EK21DRAFT_111549 [Setomelanomma holmii]
MLRPPDSSIPTRTSIHDFPDELLLSIGAQFTHLRRNRDLASLSLVSKNWRIIAQEWMLKTPRFNLTHIDKYLWEIGHHAHLLPQIHSLDIWSQSENRVSFDSAGLPDRKYVPTFAPIFLWDVTFIDKYYEVIEHYAHDKRHAWQWQVALRDDWFHSRLDTIYDFRSFENLKEVSIRMRALW